MNRYIDAEKLIAGIESIRLIPQISADYNDGREDMKMMVLDFIDSLQQEQPEENKLPNKRTRVNYAICKLQSFKPLRETIVLDDYVYDEGKCYRENLLNYIHAIPENRLTEIRSYLKENGWWTYDDDADWMDQDQSEADLDREIIKYKVPFTDEREYLNETTLDAMARHFAEWGSIHLNARKK